MFGCCASMIVRQIQGIERRSTDAQSKRKGKRVHNKAARQQFGVGVRFVWCSSWKRNDGQSHPGRPCCTTHNNRYVLSMNLTSTERVGHPVGGEPVGILECFFDWVVNNELVIRHRRTSGTNAPTRRQRFAEGLPLQRIRTYSPPSQRTRGSLLWTGETQCTRTWDKTPPSLCLPLPSPGR